MADQNLNFKVTVEGGQAQSTVGSIRKELKEANQELIRAQNEFGQFSAEAVSAAKRVAELKDQIGDAAEITALFDPGKKFAAFSTALQGVAGGFAAVQGALGLLGVESEEVEKQLLKVQSALALSEGLSTLSDLAPKLQGLVATLGQIGVVQKANAVANRLAAATMATFGVSVNTTSVAFRVLRGAIIATGIGVLVVALGTAVEALSNFSSAAEDAAEAQKTLNEEIVKGADVGLKAGLEFLDRNTKLLVSEAKARGESAEKIAKIESDALELRKKAYQRYYDEVKNADADAAIEAEKNLKNINNEIQVAENNAAAARLEKQKEAANKRKEAAKQEGEEIKQQTKDANKQLADLQQQNLLNNIKDENERAIKKLELDKKTFEAELKALKINDKIKEKLRQENAKVVDAQIREINQNRADEEAKQEAEYQQKVADVRAEVQLNAIKDEDVRSIEAIKLKYQKQFDEITLQETESGIKQTELRKALQERQAQEIEAIEQGIAERQAQKQIELNQKQIDNEKITFDERRALIDASLSDLDRFYADGLIKEDAYNKNREALTNARIELTEKEKMAQLGMLNAYADVLGGISELVGRNTAVGKALGIAQATIDTFVSTSTMFRQAANNPITTIFPAYPYIVAASSVAAGIARVRSIASVKVPGGGGASGGGIPSISSPNVSSTAPIRPTLPLTQTITQLPANTINQMGSATIRAYVVESDITTGQERIRRLNRAARLG